MTREDLLVLEQEYDKIWEWFASLNLWEKYDKKPLQKPTLIINPDLKVGEDWLMWGKTQEDGSQISLNSVVLEYGIRDTIDTILHELCHLLVWGHSLSFWSLLEDLLRIYENGKYYQNKIYEEIY